MTKVISVKNFIELAFGIPHKRTWWSRHNCSSAHWRKKKFPRKTNMS